MHDPEYSVRQLQMGRIRLGKRTDNRNPLIKEFVPLTPLENIEFGAWDLFEDNCYQFLKKNHVIFGDLVDQLREDIEDIKPISGKVFDLLT
ncbi:MAG: inositol-3-phosphate synthase [Bdellovibrionota bacterium]